MARDPASDDTRMQSYVHIVAGNGPAGVLAVENKTTMNNNSVYEAPEWPSPDAQLRICRVGRHSTCTSARCDRSGGSSLRPTTGRSSSHPPGRHRRLLAQRGLLTFVTVDAVNFTGVDELEKLHPRLRLTARSRPLRSLRQSAPRHCRHDEWCEEEDAASTQPTEPAAAVEPTEPPPPPDDSAAPSGPPPTRGGWLVPKWAVVAMVGFVAVALLFGSAFAIGRATASGGDTVSATSAGSEGGSPRAKRPNGLR